MIGCLSRSSIGVMMLAFLFSGMGLSSAYGDDKKEGASVVQEAEIPHMGGSAAMTDPMSLKTDLSLFTGVVFLLLCAGLYAVAWKPIREGLALRESSIAKQIEDAKRASEEAKAKLAEYQSKLDAATQQAQEMVAQARKDAEAAGQRILSEAQQEASRQKDRALADIEAAKVAALSELGAKSTDIAFALARGVVGRELKQADHQQLIQESLKGLSSRN